jgi:chromosomal replication initiator protein
MKATLAPSALPVIPRPDSPELLRRKLAEIRRVVADHYNIDRANLTSQSREEPLATIRQVAMFIARKKTTAVNQLIATSFARTNHGTVMHAEKVVPDKMAVSPTLTVEVEILLNKCEAALATIK